MKKITTLYLICACAAIVCSCGHKTSSTNDMTVVNIVATKSGDGNDIVTFTGKTKAAMEVNLAFRVAGQIAQVMVQEGDHVSKGQVIAVMDDRDYAVQLAATQAEYEQIKADAERVMALYQEGNTTASNNDKARYGLRQIERKLENHKNQLKDTRLRSTMDGYVQTVFHESGETVGAGMPVVSVFGSNDTEVEIKVSATDFERLTQYTNFSCRFDFDSSDSMPLELSRVAQGANASQLYTVRLRFVGGTSKRKITPGMTTMVYAESHPIDNTNEVRVPSSSVFHKDGKTWVFVYDADKQTVHQRAVSATTVNRDGTMQVESGLKSGEQVVAAGVHHLVDGQKVKVQTKPSVSNVGDLM